ncbi:MAG: hypothetical protein IKN86_10130, partial [Bacteroidaceae bacterium]|nr:hypothetical protein [Bacteroidaceae bacterium]
YPSLFGAEMEKCKWCAGALVRRCAPTTISQFSFIYSIPAVYPFVSPQKAAAAHTFFPALQHVERPESTR